MNYFQQLELRVKDSLGPIFSHYGFFDDPSAAGNFPRIYKRSCESGVGKFVDFSIRREGFVPKYAGHIPDDPELDIWFGVYLLSDSEVGRRYKLVSGVSPLMLDKIALEKLASVIIGLMEENSTDLLINERPRFMAEPICV